MFELGRKLDVVQVFTPNIRALPPQSGNADIVIGGQAGATRIAWSVRGMRRINVPFSIVLWLLRAKTLR